jgi:hypothetical protein
MESKIIWGGNTAQNFQKILANVPDMIRGIAETRVSKKAEAIVREAGRIEITEKDMVDAFFAETPFGFHGPMKTDMLAAGVDYKKYGHQ